MRNLIKKFKSAFGQKESIFLDEEKTRLSPEAMRKEGSQYCVCPACDATLLEGPSGGMSTNLYCSDEQGCGARWNYSGFMGIDAINDEAEEHLKKLRRKEQ